MIAEDQQDEQALFLILVEEYNRKHDGGAVAMVAQDAMALYTYTGIGPSRATW